MLEFEKSDYGNKWVAKLETGTRVLVGDIYGKLTNRETGEWFPQILVNLPHQCDEWEVAGGDSRDLEKIHQELHEFITEMTMIRDYLAGEEFAEFLRRIKTEHG